MSKQKEVPVPKKPKENEFKGQQVSEQLNNVPLEDGDRPLSIMEAFPTRVGHKNWNGIFDVEDINARLRANIHRRQGQDPEGIYRSNTAGTWHSDTNLMRWIDVPELGTMFHNVFSAYATTYGVSPDAEIAFKLQAWAMIYKDRGYATAHTHPNCHFSAVYYIDNPDDKITTMVTGAKIRPGDIEFIDGRPAAGYQFPDVNFQPAFRLSPGSGEMIVFPSWLAHFVHPVIGDRERMCIACNASIVKITERDNNDSK